MGYALWLLATLKLHPRLLQHLSSLTCSRGVTAVITTPKHVRPKRKRSATLIMKISAILLTPKSVNTKKSNIVRPNTKRNAPMKRNKSVKPFTKPNTTRSKSVKPFTKPNTTRSKSVKRSTKPNTTKNKSVPPPTKPKPPMKRNKNVKLLTLKSASPVTTMKRNARKSLTNLANTLMSPSTNKCLKKNVTTSKFPNKCLKKNATTSKFPKKCLSKNATISMYPNATMCPRKSAVSTLYPTAKRSPMKCAKKYPKSSATISISTHLARKSTGNAKKKLNLTNRSTKPNMTRFANK